MLHDRRRSKLVNRRWLALVVVLIAGVLAIGQGELVRVASAMQPDPVTSAWEKARAAGAYHFASNVTQTTIPMANVRNVGRQSRTEQLRLEGETNLHMNSLEMRLWAQGGSVLQGEGGVAIKVADGKSYTRRGDGQWQESEGVLDGLAPQGDFLAYLQAVREVKANPPESRAGIVFTRYSFTIDGPTFAAYVRDRMAEALRAKGELPAGINLNASDYYGKMSGDGELWVGEEGLPLRQILKLNFPAQNDEFVTAQIVVDFSRFGEGVLAPPSTFQGLEGWLAHFGLQTSDFGAVLALLTMTGLVVLIFYYRRTRLLQTALAGAVILSMVLGPLLSTFQIDAFYAAQAAQAATQEEQQATADTQRELSAALGAVEFNPQVNPVESTEFGIQDAGYGINNFQSLNLSTAQSPNLQTTDPGTNSDSDALTDFVEARVGTDPANPDTDEDGVNDAAEVLGFQLGGQTWYANALELDSNNDGLADGQEWSIDGNSQPDDTDGDGLPDAFDPDNDNDTVPDRQDLSPFSAGAATYAEATPLRLTLNNLAVNKPTLVDFQVRPTDVNRLWYAFNVLDWPRDNGGQVQDVDGATYADLASSQGRAAAPNEAFGDMKLIPMLEIRITGVITNLPAESELTPYNISVNDLTVDGSQKVVYVPLSIISSEQTGQRVAFSGRMKYLPSGSWPSPHDIRLAWVVQALVDLPCDMDNPQAVAAGCVGGYIHNAPQVIQSYYDDWTLTGFNVSEQSGAKTALIYEDPAVDQNLQDDYPLTALSYGLDNSFLAGRNADGVNGRDVDINEIARRFDRTGNGSVSSDERWGLDGALNILRVERHDYTSFDQATSHTAMTDTVGLLNTQFNGVWAANNALKPTIMFAYEQQSRSLGLDAVRTAGGYITQSGANLTVNLQPSGQPAAALNTIVGLKWTRYCRPNSGSGWSPCADEVNWEELDRRYGHLPLSDDPPGAAVAAGSNALLQIYNLALSVGVDQIVQSDNQIVADTFTYKTDGQTKTGVENGLNAGGAAVKKLANLVLMDRYLNNPRLRAKLGENVVAFVEGSTSRGLIRDLKGFRTNPQRATRIALAAGVVLTGVAVGMYFLDNAAGTNNDARLALHTLLGSAQTYASLIDPALTAVRWVRSGNSVAQLLRSSSEAIGISRTANAIGAVIAISIVWGFFIYNVTSNDISTNSIEFGAALAQAIATTIYIIVLTILSATVIGLILVGIVTVIDVILTLVCEFAGGSCFSIGGTVIKALADAFYSYGLFISTSNKDLMLPGGPRTTLADPSKGFVTGNDLGITMPITTHIIQQKPNSDIIDKYGRFLTASLRDTTFRYSLTQPNAQTVPNSGRETMRNDWRDVHLVQRSSKYSLYGAYAYTTPPPVAGFNLQAGLNRPANFYLNMGYAIPAYDCWRIYTLSGSFPFYKKIPVCSERTIDGKNSSLISALRYDIFPNTLNGFLAMTTKTDGGHGLSWDAAFSSLKDADGDGLRANIHGGLDPDDTKWDTDNDGLADGFELEARAAGTPYSPIQCDSDGDGLTDSQEEQFSTNPASADSDNDGIRDGDEVWHRVYTNTCQPTANWSGGWQVTINANPPFTVRVASNPTVEDSDGDGISDLAERQLAQLSDPAQRSDNANRPYHPNVFNTPPISVYTAADKRFVAPGQSLVYTTTVVAHTAVAPGVLDVTVPTQLGAAAAPVNLSFDPLTFSTAQTVTRQTNLSAQAGVNSQTVALNSSVRTRLPASGAPQTAWEIGSAQTLPSIPQSVGTINVAAAGPNQTGNYLLNTNTRQSSGLAGGPGVVRVNAIPSGGSSILYTATPPGTSMSTAPADVACNASGVCIAVWDQQNNTTQPSQIRAAIVDANGQVQRTLSAGGAGLNVNSFGPVIASDGKDFLLFFEYTLVNMTSGVLETYLTRNRYDSATGEFALTSTTVATVQSPRSMARTQPSLEMALVWIGDRYRLAWKVMDTSSIYASDFAADGSSLTGSNGLSQTLLTNSASPNFAEGGPAMAYDPVTNRTLLVYAAANGFLRRILWNGANLTPTLGDGNLGPDENNPDNADLQSWFRTPVVAYNPTARGWVISKTVMRQVPNPFMGQIDFYMTLGLMLWKPDLSGRMMPDVITASNGPTGAAPVLPAFPFEEMACQAPAALPVVDLRFEDLPGATSFADSSGRANHTLNCSTGCPMAGAPGAVDTSGNPIGGGPLGPASDYAVSFRGTQDQFTFPRPFDFTQNSYSLAFWYKSPPTTEPKYLQMAVGLGYALLVVHVNGTPLFAAGDRQIFSGQNLNDNQWHYIVGTFNRATNQLALYVDGVAPAVTPNGRTLFSQDPPQISVVSQRAAALDGLQVYQSALSAADVQALYNRATQSYCVGTRLGPDWLKINLPQNDPRGGKITASSGMTITIDADKPTSTLGGLVNNQFIRGNTVHTLGGNATDATAGVAMVEININNGGWQAANGAESWAYNLAVTTGNYTIQTRATDAVGNVETPAAAITLRTDSAAPNVTLNALPTTPGKPVRNAGGLWVTTLTGTVSDADSGVQVVEVLLQGQGDAVGNGWQTATRNGNNWSIDYLFPAELTDPTGGYDVSVRAVDNVSNQTADNAASGILRLDATGPAVALREVDLERALITDTLTISGLITDTGPSGHPAGIDKLEIAFVTIEQIAALPVNATPAQADAALNRTWLPVAVVQRGAGVTQSTWSVQIPSGLENEYQIDLRAADLLGNVVQTTEVWRGVIDTLAPRVVVSGSRSAISWFDPNSGQQMYDLAFTCAAVDRYLNEPTFSCPAGGAPVRSFDNNPAIQALFPDRTILNGLTVSASYWWPDPNVAITVSACDIYGHCASSSQPLPPAGSSQAASAPGTVNRAASASSAVGTVAELVEAAAVPGAPFALMVAPTAGSFVAADGDLVVTVAAEAGAALQTVTILLDNNVVQTLSFAQGENATRVLRTVNLAGVGEGPHTLVARATDWANATQSSDYGITFTLDRQAPTVTIDPATLTNADTWAVGSGVLRFNGNANDSVGLAAVQIREGNNPFVDVTFGNGTWQTALPVTDPEGRTLNITVRAIDRAGRISEVTQSIGTDLSTASAPDTTIASGPTNPSNVNTATFEFTGGATAVAFQCQLDTGEFVGCTSPWTVNGLSKGEHTLRVRAIDETGNVDLTPASFTWTVNASQLDATITASPANPSSSRDATFSFTGTGAGFECSLDGATFVVCTNPQTYTGLSYGSHTFEVRARDGSDQIGAAARHAWTIVNTAPVANDQAVSTNQDTAVAVILTASDVDALTYQVVSPPAHGVLVGTAPDLSYLPNTSFTGADSFTFRANDGRAESNLATVSINVIAVVTDNTPPTITPQVAGTVGSNGWYLSDVNLTWGVVDAESSVTSQIGCDPVTVNTETAGQPFTCTATSSGGTATQSITIKLDKTAPDTTLTAQPGNPSTTASAAFQFTGADSLSGNAGFECSLDNGAFATCPNSQNYSNLAEGSHTFRVRTVDGAGNRDTTPAEYTWTVQTLTVVATCGPITVYRNAQGQLVAPGWTGTIKLGTNGNNTIAGGSGRDLMLGLGGNDNLDGKAGDDLLCGGDGVDLVTGAAGNDVLEGGAGNDVLNGGNGDFDSLSAGDGNDVLLDGDGVINAQGGLGTDAFTLALRNGWRNQSGQPRFTGLAAGYGNDAVGLAILNLTRFFVDITGDERDNPPSPLEGNNDALVLVGLLDPTSTIIKFERRTGAARASAEGEAPIASEEPISFEGFAVDPTTLTDESGAEFLTEPVGGDEPVEEVEQTEETIMSLFLPLINR